MAMLTSREVAERLQVKPVTVTRYINKGLLAACFYGREYKVEETEVEAFLERSKDQRKVKVKSA
ncbi:MAG TPA: helix-turn-helix domain-containing protein [Nitrososphaera sp.]|jgi:excisionase family DNA binding protein|nr:helix-turn-helix domain-containing protein [Nitrososphaera sp.]